MKATPRPDYGRKLEELVEIRRRNEQAEHERDKERRRVQQEERNRVQREEAWEQFMQKEIRELGLRKEGQLARLLGSPRPGEPAEALRRLADEDKRQAQEGLVALMSGGELRYKPLDELSPEDMPARLAAERLRTTWLKKRQDGWLAQGEGSL
jgi:DNA-binding protein H-NS